MGSCDSHDLCFMTPCHWPQRVFLAEVHQVTVDNVFEGFGANRSEGYLSVIGGLALVAFLKYWGNICVFLSSHL